MWPYRKGLKYHTEITFLRQEIEIVFFDDSNLSPTLISPPSKSSKPTIIRKVVVFPQPDGP